MPYTGAGVTSYGFPIDDFTFTYLLSGTASTDDAVFATVGKAVSWDNSAANTVKPAADGDTIIGRVRQAENRLILGIKVASVARKFKEKLPAATGHGIVVGDTVLGAGAGLVKKNATATPSNARVIEVFPTEVVVEHL